VVSSYLPQLRSFKITSNKFISLDGVKRILLGCPNLKFLGIGFTTVLANCSLRELEEALYESKEVELEGLDLRGCTCENTLEYLTVFVKRWPNLKSLDIGWLGAKLTDWHVQFLLSYCKGLEDLDISWNGTLGGMRHRPSSGLNHTG